MLNKKGQLQDNLDMGIGVILIIIGVVLLQILSFNFSSTIDELTDGITEQKTDIEVLDLQFTATDLLTTLRLETQEMTTTQILTELAQRERLPLEETDSLSNYVLYEVREYNVGVFTCAETLLLELETLLGPSYGTKWGIEAKIEGDDDIFFYCPPTDNKGYYSEVVETTIQLPTQDAQTDIEVTLEVFL